VPFECNLHCYNAVAVLAVGAGVGVGFYVNSLNDILQWIVGALYGGYTAPNVLKFHWQGLAQNAMLRCWRKCPKYRQSSQNHILICWRKCPKCR
jgi:hypothetical protein